MGLAALVAETPAFVYDESAILGSLDGLLSVREAVGLRILYSIKALPFAGVLETIRPHVDGFSVSSLFEARLAAEVLRRGQDRASGAHSLHITTPGLRAEEIDEISALCDRISFNSLEQLRRLAPRLAGKTSVGVRINPGLSFLDDARHDPCRPFSKLGVPLADLAAALAADRGLAEGIEGIHFHTLFESRSFGPLRATLERVESRLGPNLERLRWVNLGGGYLFQNAADLQDLAELVRGLKDRRGVEVFFEPGKALAGRAGHLVASVVDRFERDGKAIAVLDTGVHHLPEVFEYQKPPDLAEHQPAGRYPCLLAGCTCLAGDVFGEYRFAEPLAVGDRVAFRNVGAYALVKASRFNGYDLPGIFALRPDGRLERVKRFGYGDYRRQWTADGDSLEAGDSAD